MPAKNNEKGFVKRLGKTLAYILLAVNICVSALLLMSMLAWKISPETTNLFAYLGIGFPFIFFANIAFFVFWLIVWKWKFALFNIIVFACSWSAISTYYPIHFKTGKVPDDCIKLLTYNVRAFNWEEGDKALNNPMFDYIKNMNADIICFQEFVVRQENDRSRIISENQLNKILGDYPYHSYVKLGKNGTGYAIACYSKYPIKKSHRLPLHESTFNGSVAFDLDIKGKKVLLINNHLASNQITPEDKRLYSHFMESKDTKTLEEVTLNIKSRLSTAYAKRQKQVDYISDYIEKEKNGYAGIIVCGDFNDTPISYVYRKMKADRTDAFASTGFGPGITYHENKFWFRIDYIMHSEEIESFNAEVGSAKYSDHYPLTAYLRFK